MSKIRVWIEGPLNLESEVDISPREAHHLKVRRASVGDEVILLDGMGREATGEVLSANPWCIKIIEVKEVYFREPKVELTLFIALLKGEKMDWVVQKATELGVRKIIPFIASRSVPRLHPQKVGERVERWRSVAVDALKQCGGTILPKISPLIPLEEISLEVEGRGWVLWGGEREKRLTSSECRRVSLVVGPEGGLEEEEVLFLLSKGFRPATLGPRILRSETAVILASGLILYGG